MKAHLEHISHVCTTKMAADGKPARGRTRILTDSDRKRNRKEVLANYSKTRINIGHQHDRWVELKEALRVQFMLKCKDQCHCACSSEILTYIYIIYDAVRQAARKKQRKYTFCTRFDGKYYLATLNKKTLIFCLPNSTKVYL
jgi:hypothetical protein